jgi:pilus assembly protein CpaF
MEGPIVTLQEVFVFEKQGMDAEGRVLGRFRPTGVRPHYTERLIASGIRFDADQFSVL